MTDEELQTIRNVMCEEIYTALAASEQRADEQLQSVHFTMREEMHAALAASEQRTSAQLQALRLATREEINTALMTSEQRATHHFDTIDVDLDKITMRLDKIDVHQGLLDARMGRVGGRMDQLEASQRDLHEGILQIKIELHSDLAQIKADHQDILLKLNEVTMLITALQAEQQSLAHTCDDHLQAFRRDLQKIQADHRNLENKLDQHFPALRQHMQALIANTQKLAQDFIEVNRLLNTRLTYHENSPIGETHPRAQQPGAAA